MREGGGGMGDGGARELYTEVVYVECQGEDYVQGFYGISIIQP